MNPISAVSWGAAYGAVATVAQPWVAQIPQFAGSYTQNIVRGLAAYGMTKFAPTRKLGIAGLTAEGFILGSQLATQTGLAGMISGTSNASSSPSGNAIAW